MPNKDNAQKMAVKPSMMFKAKKVTNDRTVGTFGEAFKKGENERPTE